MCKPRRKRSSALALAAIAGTAGVALVSAYAAPITDALMIILAGMGAVAAAGIAWLAILLRPVRSAARQPAELPPLRLVRQVGQGSARPARAQLSPARAALPPARRSMAALTAPARTREGQPGQRMR